MQIASDWKDFELLDAGEGEKLERWGGYVLRRPDPQAIWPRSRPMADWKRADGHYHRSESGGGRWEFRRSIPKQWTIMWRSLSFHVEPTGFKHTGLFPEQAVNWSWIMDRVASAGRPATILNLFAYTGGATVAAASAGASVCHVDAAKRMVGRARENLQLSGLGDRPVRFITDDVFKFIQREERRGRKYDGIIIDPPSYGRGPGGELWKLEDTLYDLVKQCAAIVSEKPLFVLINGYTTGFSASVAENMLRLVLKGNITSGEVGLPVSGTKLILPCGTFARWQPEH